MECETPWSENKMGFDEFGSEIELDGEMSFFVIGNNLIFFFFGTRDLH